MANGPYLCEREQTIIDATSAIDDLIEALELDANYDNLANNRDYYGTIHANLCQLYRRASKLRDELHCLYQFR